MSVRKMTIMLTPFMSCSAKIPIYALFSAAFFPQHAAWVMTGLYFGGMLLGPAYGTALGLIFGLIVLVMCAAGMDAGGAILFQANPFLCSLLCLLKGGLAGFAPAFLFHKTKEITRKSDGHFFGVTILGAGLCPVLNTGIFCLGMIVFYKDILLTWAGGTNVITYVLLGLTGINFVIEFLINIILCPLVVRSLRNTRYFKHNV